MVLEELSFGNICGLIRGQSGWDLLGLKNGREPGQWAGSQHRGYQADLYLASGTRHPRLGGDGLSVPQLPDPAVL